MRPFPAFLLFFLLIFSSGLAGAGDEQTINERLKNGNVQLEARTYVITSSIILQSDRTLEGVPGTIITIPDRADWEVWEPFIKGTSVQNVVIKNIEFNGNCENNRDIASKTKNGKAWGNGFYNFIHVIDCDSIEVSGCLMHDSWGDGFRVKTSTNCKFFGNTAYRLGHDVFYAIDSQNIEAYNNRITTRTNSALRLWNVAHARLYDNVIDAQLDGLGGNPGIQVEDSKGVMYDIEICNNIVQKTWGSFLWLIAYEQGAKNTQAVYIHHNLVYQAAQSHNIGYAAGITCAGQTGTIVKNNVFDGTRNTAWDGLSGGNGAIIQDNIITNTVDHAGGSKEGSGYGIANIAGSDLSIISNCFFNNLNGNLYKCSSSGDDRQDPKTHATSSGWTWTGSTWTCDRVPPMELGSITPASTRGTIDTDTHDFDSIFDVLNLEFIDNALGLTQGTIIPVPEWEEKKKAAAYIYLAGYDGQITINNHTYIPKNPWECARISTGTKNLASKPAGQTSELKLSEGPNNGLHAELKVKTKFKTKVQKSVTILGKSVSYDGSVTESKTEIFERDYPAPEVFPVISEKDLNISVKYFNNTYNPHTAITIEPKKGTIDVFRSITYKYNGSIATDERYLGHVSRQENGFKTVNYKETTEWISLDGFITYRYQGCFIPGPLDPSLLSVDIATPYDNFTITHFDVEEIKDPTIGVLRKLLILFTILGFLGMFVVSGFRMLSISFGGTR